MREKLDEEANSALKEKTYILSAAAAKLDALSPLKVLSRGYSVCQKDGQAVFSASEVQTGDEVKVLLCQGTISAQFSRQTARDNYGEYNRTIGGYYL